MSKNTMRLLFIITTLPFLFALTANADLAIVSQSNKQNYVCGEPIILHMTVQTGANEHSFKSRYGLGWGKAGVFGFSLEIARDGGDYLDVLSHLPYASRVSKGFDEFFRDRYPIPILIPSNTTFSRIDMLLLKPGNYKLRAVILDIDKRRYVSNEITMTVNPVEGHDSIERMGNSDYAWRLGHNIFNEHYVQSMTRELMSEEFLSACDTILNDYQDSVFYPYVLYAMVKMHLYQRMSPGPTDAQKEQALAAGALFMSQYPDSWLIPEVGITMCSEYRRLGNVEAALVAGRLAINVDPHSLLLHGINFHERFAEFEAIHGDTVQPQISVLSINPVTVQCSAGYTDAGATATDNKDGDLTGSITVQNNVDTTEPGAYTVVYTVNDAAGNTATATRTVNVVDTTPPVLTCQAAQVHKPETCGGVVNFNLPTAMDQCAGSVAVTCVPANGNVLATGVHTVNCSATDSANNTGTCSFTVDVKERLQVRFVAPLADDNADNNIETDADVVNTFKVGSRVIHKVKLFDCAGTDVTEAYASLVTVKLDVTLRTTTNAGSEVVNDVPEVSSGVGNAGGLMIPVGGHFQYNLDTTGYAAGTVNDGRFYRSDVTVEWVSAPGLAVGGEDALLESKP